MAKRKRRPITFADGTSPAVGIHRRNSNAALSKHLRMLDTNTFERCFQQIWNNLSEDKRASFAFLDCLWFSLYLHESSRENVLKWIKRKRIFSKKYVVVPIVCWNHWSLLILCHFGERSKSKTRTPCMLLLDSLHMANPVRLEPEIRKFVMDVFKAEERPERKPMIFQIPLLVPKVPQQRDGEECGHFVLYFASLFIKNAPENFSTVAGYPYFMKKDWFCSEDLDNFCRELNLSQS